MDLATAFMDHGKVLVLKKLSIVRQACSDILTRVTHDDASYIFV